ncbi:hypothetical protein [Clostridium thermobutyricum]|uniref:hypothetical protein n=1 Tax=Clostridium thermobutyricum TaxID=29372 RepID=UPI0018AB1043|nr:hypothetical protein [Clostridium thermobutyricum]
MKKLIIPIIIVGIIALIMLILDGNENGIGPMRVKNEMNSSGTIKIGEYGIAYYSGNISDADIINFYNNNVKDTDLDYVTLINKNDDNEGYVFKSSSEIFKYGEINKEGILEKSEKTGVIVRDKLEY